MRTIIEIFVCACLFISTASGQSESDLRRALFQNQDIRLIRPVKVVTNVVKVQIHLGLLVIKEVDVRDQIAKFDSWLFLTWQNEFFSWDPREYGGLQKLIIPPSQVWTPDIGLYSGTPDVNIFPTVLTNVIIYSNGTCVWELPFTVHTYCYEPQPTATTYGCRAVFGSWTYDVTLLDVQQYVMNVFQDSKDIFHDINGKWTFESVRATRNVVFYDIIQERFSTVTFDIVFKRKPGSREDDSRSDSDEDDSGSDSDEDDSEGEENSSEEKNKSKEKGNKSKENKSKEKGNKSKEKGNKSKENKSEEKGKGKKDKKGKKD